MTMMSALITATLVVILWSLWVRRATWGSRWEAGASTSIALQGCALLLMSPWASANFGPPLYRVLGRWNLEDLLGHICLIVAVMAIIHHGLTRLAHQDLVQTLFRRQVIGPARFGVLLLLMVFIVADEGYHRDLFPAQSSDIWLDAYWLVLGGLLIYLFIYAGRVLLILRQDDRATATADLYLIAAAFAAAAHAIQIGTAWAGVDVTMPVWVCACLGAVGFAYGSARSWQAKINWFKRDDRPAASP